MNNVEISALIGFALTVLVFLRLAVEHHALKRKYKTLRITYDDLRPSLRQELERDNNRKMRIESDKRIKKFNEALSQENIHLLSQALTCREAKEWVSHAQTIVENQFGKMTQEFLGSLTDETEGLTRDVQFSLSEKLWDSMQQMKEKQDDSPYLLPRNVRIAYTKGTRTVVIIEQMPQMRTIAFAGGLLDNSEAENATSKGKASWCQHGFYRFNLSFPYVYFIMMFDSGRFSCMEVFFRNKALSSPKDKLGVAPLPNIHRRADQGFSRTYSPMCLGAEFRETFDNTRDISVQCDEVVSHFWQAPFNSHLGKFGIDKKELDERIRDYGRWQEESAANPLFILTVDWPGDLTVKGLLEKALDRDRQKHALNSLETQIKKMLDDGVKKITTRVKDEITTSQQKHTLKTEEITRQIQADVEATLTSHADKVFAICRKQF